MRRNTTSTGRGLAHRLERASQRVGDTAAMIALSSFFVFVLDRCVERMADQGDAGLSFAAGVSLWGGHAAAQVGIAALLALVSAGSIAIERVSRGGIPAARANPVLLGALAFVPFFKVGSALSAGDWISSQPCSGAIAPILALLGATFFFAAGTARASSSSSIRAAYAAGCGCVALVSLLADALVYPEIYLAFHWLAYGTSSAMFFLLGERLVHSILPGRPRRLQTLARAGTVMLSFWGLLSFWFMSQEVRSELLIKTRTAGYLMPMSFKSEQSGRLGLVLARVADGRPISFQTTEHPDGALVVPGDWNIMLLMIDAMRADTLPPSRSPGLAHARKGDTPFLDQWISDTYRFEFAYSPANITHVSMPSIFQGLVPPSIRKRAGTSLPVHMARRGRKPIAVVNKLFSSKRKRKIHNLLKGFGSVAYYSDKRQKRAVDYMLRAVDKVAGQTFFSWFHFYCMHNPYHAEQGIQTDSEGPFPERYRNALRWLDTELERFFAGLERRGITNNTIFILTADHGEGLGARRLNTHGSYVFDEETRVPLFIKIPGRSGAAIERTVGLIDLVATLCDLLGQPLEGSDGTSLVPLMMEPGAEWNRDYYLENSSNNYMGVVRGRDKLVYFRDNDALFRFDLVSDPGEKNDLYDETGELDQILLSRLVYYQPELFTRELKDPKTRALFDRLHEISKDLAPQSATRMLLERVASMIASPRPDR